MAVNEKYCILKRGREKAIINRHHWIFSGAVERVSEYENGEILRVYDHSKNLLGSAYFNKSTSICGRMIAFGDSDPLAAVNENIKNAVEMRRRTIDPRVNAFRVINAEGDLIPGLVADKYDDVLVIQVSTAGIERLKKDIVAQLASIFSPACIYEKSTMPSRKEEGLAPFEGVICGILPDRVLIDDCAAKFYVDIADSQKTGFYLDQSQLRRTVASHAKGRRVLNCFSYTGGFTVYALNGGALSVDSVDQSENAIELTRENVRLNGFDPKNNKFYVADVFEFLRSCGGGYDFIILDPPAFAKKKNDVVKACRAYKDINRVALQKIAGRGLVLTCSCSYFVDETLFRQVIFQAAAEARRNVKILQKHIMACDHPINIYHPETDYLKSFLLYVE